jgi:hypothetical protein
MRARRHHARNGDARALSSVRDTEISDPQGFGWLVK